jgi:hypothetical protein
VLEGVRRHRAQDLCVVSIGYPSDLCFQAICFDNIGVDKVTYEERSLDRTGGPKRQMTKSKITVIEKVKHYDTVLGGIARLDFQMSVASLDHAQLLASTRLPGEHVRLKVLEA